MDEAKNQINDLDHKETKNNHEEQQEEKELKTNEDNASSLWHKFKRFTS